MTDEPKYATPDGKPARDFNCPQCGEWLFQDRKTYDIRCKGGCIFLRGWVEVLSTMIRRSEQMMQAGVRLLRDVADLNRILALHSDDPAGVMDIADKCDKYADRFLAVGNDISLFGEGK